MMLIKTYIAPSPIHGLGIFTAQFVRYGTKLWEFTVGFDQIIPDALFNNLTLIQRESLSIHLYREPTINQMVLCCDNARYFNFSADPNCGETEQDKYSTYALRNIQENEELTYPAAEDLDAINKLGIELYEKLKQERQT